MIDLSLSPLVIFEFSITENVSEDTIITLSIGTPHLLT